MTKKKHSSGKVLLVIVLSMIQLLQLVQSPAPINPTENTCTGNDAGRKRNNGIDGTCIDLTANCADLHSFSGFYAVGSDCRSCAIGNARATDRAACTAACTGANPSFLGYATINGDPSCAADNNVNCQTGYARNSAGQPCTNCDIVNDRLRHNERCKLIADICTGTTAAFDGTACVGSLTTCRTEYYAHPVAPTLCIYCSIGHTKDPLTTACVRACAGATPRFRGFTGNPATATCAASTDRTACEAGYAVDPNDTTNNACTRCDVGFVNQRGRCVLVTEAVCQAIAGNPATAFDGIKCVPPPSGANVTCQGNTFANLNQPNLCLYCRIGFRRLNGTCVQVDSNPCAANLMWDGSNCVAIATSCPAASNLIFA